MLASYLASHFEECMDMEPFSTIPDNLLHMVLKQVKAKRALASL
jgi:hypothetical protein